MKSPTRVKLIDSRIILAVFWVIYDGLKGKALSDMPKVWIYENHSTCNFNKIQPLKNPKNTSGGLLLPLLLQCI